MALAVASVTLILACPSETAAADAVPAPAPGVVPGAAAADAQEQAKADRLNAQTAEVAARLQAQAQGPEAAARAAAAAAAAANVQIQVQVQGMAGGRIQVQAGGVGPIQIQANGGPVRIQGLRGDLQVRGRDVAFGDDNSKAIEPERPKFAPESEKEFAELMAKFKEAKRKVWTERMGKEVEEMAKKADLTEEEKKALDAPAKQAIENCLVLWLDKMDAMLRKTAQRQVRNLSLFFNQYRQMADNYAENDIVPGVKQPMNNEAWTDGWRKALAAAHIEKWDKVLAERKVQARDEMKDVLKPMEDRARDQFASVIGVKAAEIKETLKLPAERAAALDALGKQAVDQSMAAWSARAETTVVAMSNQRRKVMLQGRLFVGPDPLEAPDVQKAWTDGVPKLLSPEEVRRLAEVRGEHRARRVRNMAQLFLLYLDEKVALTATQRERLLPIAEQIVQKQATLFPPEGEDLNGYLNPRIFLAAGQNPPEKEVRAIIVDDQWEHWKKVCVPPTNDEFGQPATEEPKDSAATTAEPEPIEQAISNFMAGKAVRQRQRMTATLLLQAEDAARVAGLSSAAYQRLQTGARGATEKSLQAWTVQFEQIVRGNMNEVTPQTLKQRLAGLENYNQFQVPGDKPQQQALWKKSVEVELTPEQRAVWQKEVDARKEFREKTIIGTVLAEFDRQIPLRAEQWEKLEAMMLKLIAEYNDEISNFFSFNEGSAWYLQSYTRFMPLAGLNEDDLKALLGKEQWERWTKTDEFTNAKNYWNNIKQNHQNRRR